MLCNINQPTTSIVTLLLVSTSKLCSAALPADGGNAGQEDCKPENWALQKQNWTDGDPSVDEVPMCSLLPSAMLGRDTSSQSCRRSIAVPKVMLLTVLAWC